MNGIVVAMLLTCGTERESVKTLSDVAVGHLQTTPRKVSVEMLGGYPSEYTQGMPRQHSETQLWLIEGSLIGAKLEDDGDVHAVLAGKTGATLIIEFPDPSCTKAAPANYQAQMAKARAAVLRLLPKLSKKFLKLAKPVRVKVMGVQFWDKLHGQGGVAPNGVELHPVLSIQ